MLLFRQGEGHAERFVPNLWWEGRREALQDRRSGQVQG